MFHKTGKIAFLSVFIGLFLFAGILTFWLPLLQAFRLVFGIVFLLFVPGFFVTEFAFPRESHEEQRQLDWIERITLSFALSISVVPLIVFFLNKAGIAITALNIFLEVAGLVFVLGIIIAFQRFWRKKRASAVK